MGDERASRLLAAAAQTGTAPPPPTEARGPMPGAWNATVLIGTHHKTGTVLLAKIFRVAAHLMLVPRYKNNYTACAELFARRAPGVCIDEHLSAHSLRAWLRPEQPLIHVVRAPVEMCVSAYLYHLQGAEPWLLKPLPDLGGLTLQQHYQALGAMEGVRFECRRLVSELVEAAVVYNRTRSRRNVLSLRFEAFAYDFDRAVQRIFGFLDSGEATPRLLKGAAQFDLQREQPEDDRHVSTASDKAPLRAHLAQDAPMARLLGSLAALLGYAEGPLLGPEALCEQVRALCATTSVRFFQWCAAGRVLRGQVASLPACGEPSGSRGEEAAAQHLERQYGVRVLVDDEW